MSYFVPNAKVHFIFDFLRCRSFNICVGMTCLAPPFSFMFKRFVFLNGLCRFGLGQGPREKRTEKLAQCFIKKDKEKGKHFDGYYLAVQTLCSVLRPWVSDVISFLPHLDVWRGLCGCFVLFCGVSRARRPPSKPAQRSQSSLYVHTTSLSVRSFILGPLPTCSPLLSAASRPLVFLLDSRVLF